MLIHAGCYKCSTNYQELQIHPILKHGKLLYWWTVSVHHGIEKAKVLKWEQLQNCSFLLDQSDIDKSTSDPDHVLAIPSFSLARDYQHLLVEKKLGCNVFSVSKEEEWAVIKIQVAERSCKSQKTVFSAKFLWNWHTRILNFFAFLHPRIDISIKLANT